MDDLESKFSKKSSSQNFIFQISLEKITLRCTRDCLYNLSCALLPSKNKKLARWDDIEKKPKNKY